MKKIFPNMTALQRQALDAFRQSDIGKVARELQSLRGTRGITRSRLSRLASQLSRLGGASAVQRNLRGTEFGQVVGEVDRYARGDIKEALFDALFKALGPVGSFIGSLLRPRGRRVAPTVQQELDVAAELLRQFGYNVQEPGAAGGQGASTRTGGASAGSGSATRPGGASGVPRPGRVPPGGGGAGGTAGTSRGGAVGGRASQQEAMEDLLERAGFSAEPPPPEERKPPKPRKVSGRPGWVTVGPPGQRYTVPENDPLLTGEMIRVRSSNVHSIGYIWNNKAPRRGTLQVRFLGGGRGEARHGKGPLYYYMGVPPELFIAFQKASSKGKWVWDNLRIRGTVSGHQYPYKLAALDASGYVPRQATRLGDEEWFLRRTVRSRSGATYKSILEDQFVKYWSGEPNRGRTQGPNRGRPEGPNRGRPNRGR